MNLQNGYMYWLRSGFVPVVFMAALTGVFFPGVTNAQLGFLNPVLPRDSAYIKTYPEGITGRTLLQRKYTNFSMPGGESAASFRYLSNKRVLAGAGFVYKFLNLNLSVGLPYLNGDMKAKGKTKSLDLQSHIFGRRWMFDLYGQFYSGFHIDRKNFVTGYEPYYFRDDIRLRLIGGNASYIFNPEKFSFRMALLQDEWQQRSSGTFMLNFGAYYGAVYSNDMRYIIPEPLADQYANARVSRFRFVNFGPGAGYAYHAVIKQHFFLSGSLSANIMASFMREHTDEGLQDVFRIQPGMAFLASAGYNSDHWIFSMSWLNSTLYYAGYSGDGNYAMQAGLYRFTVARRFNNGKVSRKILRPVDKASRTNILHRIFKPDNRDTLKL